MTKAYVVTAGYDNHVLAVFTNKTDATKYARKYREWGASIEEGEVNPRIPGMMWYEFHILQDGSVVDDLTYLKGDDWAGATEEWRIPWDRRHGRKFMILIYRCNAATKQAALRIAKKRHAQIIRAGEWALIPAGTYVRCPRCGNDDYGTAPEARDDRGGRVMCEPCYYATWPGLGVY